MYFPHPSLFPDIVCMLNVSHSVCTALKNPISPGQVPSMVEKQPIMPFVMRKMISPQRRGSPLQTEAIGLRERNALHRFRQMNPEGRSEPRMFANKRKIYILRARQQAINIITCNNLALRVALYKILYMFPL